MYRQYTGEDDLPHIMALVQTELSEPYVIYTYRYFLHQWYVHTSPTNPVALLTRPLAGHSSHSSCVSALTHSALAHPKRTRRPYPPDHRSR